MVTNKSQTRDSISRVLKKLLKKQKGKTALSYGELIDEIGDQAFGLIIILFALPSALPISAIPGFSFLFGLPIVFIAVQLILARKSLWLPKRLRQQTVNINKFGQIINKTLPYLMYIERLFKPRWSCFSTPVMERLHGIILLLLSLLLLLPIPFSNFIFASLIILFGFGMAERDGIALLLAYLGSLLYAVFLTSLIHKLIKAFFY